MSLFRHEGDLADGNFPVPTIGGLGARGSLSIYLGGITMLDNDVTPARKQVGRRALTRGAAWSVPVVTLAMAAPANAATSGCTLTTGQLVWSGFSNKSNQLNKFLATTVAGVTVKVTTAGGTGADDNGIATTDTVGGSKSLLLFHDENNVNNTAQTITITFSKAVRTLSFSLLDIDSSQSTDRHGTKTNDWEDQVVVTGPSGFVATKGSTVVGSGATGDPFKAKTMNTPVTDDSSTGNVALSWAHATDDMTSVTLVYSQNGTQHGSPKMGISDITFSLCA
jgi:hypothetical protein